ncbi:MAG: saccharopine dehydrogenase NADP-binding domain-containing protein, partial [Ginsengibacter sp.]
MKHIVLFGAGKSATCLIDYLLKEIQLNHWKLTVCDSNLALAQSKIDNAQNASALSILVENDGERNSLIQSADIVISLLPAELHFIVAKDCIT